MHRNNAFVYYIVHRVVSDESGMAINGRFDVCKGDGFQRWIHALGTTIVIKPKQLLFDHDINFMVHIKQMMIILFINIMI